MNLKDVLLAKKLGDKFFKFNNELSESQKKFKNFKAENLIRVVESQEIKDTEKAVSRFNQEIRDFWVSVFLFKSFFYVNSRICNSIASKKVDMAVAKSIARKFVHENSIADVSTLYYCLLHFEILSTFYYVQYLDSLDESDFELMQAHLEERGIEEMSSKVLKNYLSTEVNSSLQAQILLHFYKLIEQAWKDAKQISLGPFSDDDLLKYKLVLSRAFVKRASETTEEASQETRDFIVSSFNPFAE